MNKLQEIALKQAKVDLSAYASAFSNKVTVHPSVTNSIVYEGILSRIDRLMKLEQTEFLVNWRKEIVEKLEANKEIKQTV
jgi:pantothenate kinase-related protein Tda10